MKSRGVEILGVGVDAVTRADLRRRIECFARDESRGRPAAILNVNAHALNLASRDREFRGVFHGAEVVFCDGAGVRLAARMLGGRLPERITYADWTEDLAKLAAENGFSLYLLGARPGVARTAAQRLLAANPNLLIAGLHHGYFDRDGAENDEVVSEINAASPDILLVAMGMPIQERWLMRNLSSLEARVALTGGAALDYASGGLRRGPKFLTDNGFEWLARLLIEPRRLWRRYVIGNPVFIFRVLRQAARQRLGKSS